MSEDRATRIRRLTMRSWRRGMREVDLILGPFAEARLPEMDGPRIGAYEALLSQNDQDIYSWIAGTGQAPEIHGKLVNEIIEFISAGGSS